MKKKTIILIGILVLVALIFLARWYILFNYDVHIGKIISIDEDNIIIKADSGMRYTFSVQDKLIINEKWRKVSSSTLNVEDTLYIINKKDKITLSIGYVVEPIHNVKLIKILNNESVN